MNAVRNEAKYFVTLAVEDVPDLALFVVTDTMISPEQVRIIYTWQRRPDHRTQPVTISVSGPRRLDDGELDRYRTPARTFFNSEDRDEWPDWLEALVKEHAPQTDDA